MQITISVESPQWTDAEVQERVVEVFGQNATAVIRRNPPGDDEISAQCADYLRISRHHNAPLSLAVFGITASTMTTMDAAVALRVMMRQVSEHMIQYSRTEDRVYITRDNLVHALLIHTDMLQAVMYAAHIFSRTDAIFPEAQLRCGIASFDPQRHADYASLVRDAIERYQRVGRLTSSRVCYSD